MLNDQTQQRPTTNHNHGAEDDDDDDEQVIREIHALTPPPLPPPHLRHPRPWETSSIRSTSSEGASSENFTTMSREFNALVVAGSVTANHGSSDMDGNNNLTRIGEEEEEMNPLAIVPDNNNPIGDPLPSPRPRTNSNLGGVIEVGSGGGGGASSSSSMINTAGRGENMMMHQVKREEVETKITAWQTAKVAKINNRFKREDAVISGWESEQVQKSTCWMKKVERKLEEKRAKAHEKMQNELAKAHRKAEERRASAEAKRGTKVARVFEIANLMRALGRPPTKRSFF